MPPPTSKSASDASRCSAECNEDLAKNFHVVPARVMR
eukprot:CAMPEP_0204135382 /NCGR_PEP_ID=MMETSP0361-20130328/16219_1 /ASSEMBLY_ACC=CAM_ASM_000343 /TAXON_ID=268821 /ORGANISM="Scrippsiella Hangoei, Strain SHTV-5" /LENGTH=36 /DNA_ID= /DNA_START= /DNA_END= /DNA_ORIENTATION=